MNYAKSNCAFNEIMEHWSKNNFGVWALKETENPDFEVSTFEWTQNLSPEALSL